MRSINRHGASWSSTLCSPHPWKGYPAFWSFELLQDVLKRNNSIHHSYCQTKSSHEEFAAALLGKGRDTQVSQCYCEGAACQPLCYHHLAEFSLCPRITHSNTLTRRPSCKCNVAQHRPAPAWVHCEVAYNGLLDLIVPLRIIQRTVNYIPPSLSNTSHPFLSFSGI